MKKGEIVPTKKSIEASHSINAVTTAKAIHAAMNKPKITAIPINIK